MMHIQFLCPHCSQPVTAESEQWLDVIRCSHCQWERIVPAADGQLQGCPVCGCDDLWRQKNFPQGLGLSMVALAALLSTWAWWLYEPVWALGILLFFALIDWGLYMFMPDVLVCYRCRTRLSGMPDEATVPKFDLEIQERYRQQAIVAAKNEQTIR
ncbi:MAG: hypothetical protein ACKVT0_23615 [Planctomycetaceae bacterium]